MAGRFSAKDDIVSKRLINGIVVLLLAILTLVAVHSWSGAAPQSRSSGGELLAERSIVIQGSISGAVRVTDADGAEIVDLPSGKGVFLTTIDRAMERERAKFGVEMDAPYLLRLREGGRVALFDPSLDREIFLNSFGPDNAAAFAALLDFN